MEHHQLLHYNLFFFRSLSIFNTYMGEENVFFKETYSCIYPKKPNSWIQSTCFKSLYLTLCEINPLFFLLRIISIFKTYMGGEKI